MAKITMQSVVKSFPSQNHEREPIRILNGFTLDGELPLTVGLRLAKNNLEPILPPHETPLAGVLPLAEECRHSRQTRRR